MVTPLPLLRPPPPDVRCNPDRVHSDSQRIPSFQPIIVTSSIVTSDQTARSPTDVESELAKPRAISTVDRSASTSRTTNPFSCATNTTLLAFNDHPEMVPPFSKLNVESSIFSSPEPETSNNLLLYCTDISLMLTVPAPRRRAKVSFALTWLTGKPEPTNAKSPSIRASIQGVVPPQVR